MNNIETTSLIENYNQVKNLYDQEFFDSSSLLSIIKFLIYFPFGLVLLFLRIILICLLNLIIKLVPNLQNNRSFIRLAVFSFGISIRLPNENKQLNNETANKCFVSNHVTCLDYLAIKSVLNDSNYWEESNLKRHITNDSKFDLIARFFYGILHLNSKKNTRMGIYFPEQISTTGMYGVVKFDSNLFDQDQSATYVPVSIRVKHTLIPFRTNYIYSNDFVNTFANLYSPFTVYELNFLASETRVDTESSEQFAERLRAKIAANLNIKLIDFNHDRLRQIYIDYKKFLREQQRQQIQQRQQEQQRPQRNLGHSRNETISFHEMSRVALQIKDILPDVSFETIKHHVNSTASLDVDTIIASILDSNQANTTSKSTPMSLDKASNQTQTNKKINSIMTYEERKFMLLTEARKRYLAKNKN